MKPKSERKLSPLMASIFVGSRVVSPALRELCTMNKPTFREIEFADGERLGVVGWDKTEIYDHLQGRDGYEDCYIEYFPERGLVWLSEEESRNDDGAKATAVIHYQ